MAKIVDDDNSIENKNINNESTQLKIKVTEEEKVEQEKKQLTVDQKKELKLFMWKGVKFILFVGLIFILISVGFHYLLLAID